MTKDFIANSVILFILGLVNILFTYMNYTRGDYVIAAFSGAVIIYAYSTLIYTIVKTLNNKRKN